MRIGTTRLASWMSVWTLALLSSLTLAFPAAAADPLAVRVFTDKVDYTRGEQALLTMEVTNTSALPVTVSYNNGQQYDFELRDTSGALVWSWSYGKSFGSLPTSRTIAAGETVQIQEAWAQSDNAGSPVLDGTYTVSGIFHGNYLGKSGPKVATQDISVFTPDPLVATFSTSKAQYSRLTPAQMTLTITNVASYPVTVSFANEQQFDFSARNAKGEVVWTWSYGKTFAEVPSEVVLGPGEYLEFVQSWSFSANNGGLLPDGWYTVSGSFLGQYAGAVYPKGGESQIRMYTLF
jgi:hypothetical protein